MPRSRARTTRPSDSVRLRTTRHVSNAQDHDLAASAPDGVEQAVSEGRQRHAMNIGLVRFASHAWNSRQKGCNGFDSIEKGLRGSRVVTRDVVEGFLDLRRSGRAVTNL